MFAPTYKLIANSTNETSLIITPTDSEATPKGRLGDMLPLDIIQRLPLASWDVLNLASSSKFFKQTLQEQRYIAIASQKHLRQLLRLEEPTITTSLSDIEKVDMQCINTLLVNYKDYFHEYRSQVTPCKFWPKNENLDNYYNIIKNTKKTLPIKLTVDTVFGFLQAKFDYLEHYRHMAYRQAFKWEILDKLAVKGIGSAQKAAGKNVCNYYFHGNKTIEANIYRRLGVDLFLYMGCATKDALSKQTRLGGDLYDLDEVLYNRDGISLVDHLIASFDVCKHEDKSNTLYTTP